MAKFRVYLLLNDRIQAGEQVSARCPEKAVARARALWGARSRQGAAWSIEVWQGARCVHQDDFNPPDDLHTVAPWSISPAAFAAVQQARVQP